MRATADLLLDIRDAAQDVLDFATGLDLAAFEAIPDTDRRTYRAIKNALVELGEAVKGLPADLCARHGQVDWRGLAGLRDVVVHRYFGVDMRRLWPTVRMEFPTLLAVVAEEIARTDRE